MDTPRVLEPQDLEAGDVLLHMGRGELSRLIAWVSDGAYSHAAVVFDEQQLIEAGTRGIRHASLAERSEMGDDYQYIDVFRPHRLQGDDRAALVGSLRSAFAPYLGRPHPTTPLLMLGVACAVRDKVPDRRALRRVMRMTLDLVAGDELNPVIGSELVYRAFEQAATDPGQALRLPITPRPRLQAPMPDIDPFALAHECLGDLRQAGRPPSLAGEIALLAAPLHGMDEVAEAASVDAPDHDDLATCLSEARARLGLGRSSMITPTVAASARAAPSPRTVLPADLEFSPGLQRMGRLKLVSG